MCMHNILSWHMPYDSWLKALKLIFWLGAWAKEKKTPPPPQPCGEKRKRKPNKKKWKWKERKGKAEVGEGGGNMEKGRRDRRHSKKKWIGRMRGRASVCALLMGIWSCWPAALLCCWPVASSCYIWFVFIAISQGSGAQPGRQRWQEAAPHRHVAACPCRSVPWCHICLLHDLLATIAPPVYTCCVHQAAPKASRPASSWVLILPCAMFLGAVKNGRSI